LTNPNRSPGFVNPAEAWKNARFEAWKNARFGLTNPNRLPRICQSGERNKETDYNGCGESCEHARKLEPEPESRREYSFTVTSEFKFKFKSKFKGSHPL